MLIKKIKLSLCCLYKNRQTIFYNKLFQSMLSQLQVDLEAFSSKNFYSILSKQSKSVTSTIGLQKDEIKSLFQKVLDQVFCLKGI